MGSACLVPVVLYTFVLTFIIFGIASLVKDIHPPTTVAPNEMAMALKSCGRNFGFPPFSRYFDSFLILQVFSLILPQPLSVAHQSGMIEII